MRKVQPPAPLPIRLPAPELPRPPLPSPPAPRAVSRLPEILFAATVLLLSAIRLIQAHDDFLHRPAFDWSASEWMIDYAAGFVRRGLGGTLLLHLLRLTGWGFFPVLAIFTTTLYLGLCAGLVAVSWRLRGPALWRFALLFNPLLLLSICDYGTIARRDTLFLWGTLLHVLLGEWLLRRPRTRASALWLAVSVAALALVLALLHEGIFLFLWLPLNLALFSYLLAQMHCRRRAIALLLLVAFAPALLAVAASALRHGDLRTAQAICRSWRFALPLACSPGGALPPALDALTWSLPRALSLSLAYAWRFPLYPLLYALFGALQVLAVHRLQPTARLAHLLALLAFPFAAALPLFLLGVDWGRWLSLLALSSLIVMLSSLRPALYSWLPAALRPASRHSLRPLAALRRAVESNPLLFCALLLFVPIPPIPKMAVAFLNPPLIVLRFLLQRFAS